MNNEDENMFGWIASAVILLIMILIVSFTLTAIKRTAGENEINEYTHDNTRYIVKDKLVFNHNLVSYFNPSGGKDHYKVEVQKYKADKHGVQRWQYDKTIDYGTHEPDITK